MSKYFEVTVRFALEFGFSFADGDVCPGPKTILFEAESEEQAENAALLYFTPEESSNASYRIDEVDVKPYVPTGVEWNLATTKQLAADWIELEAKHKASARKSAMLKVQSDIRETREKLKALKKKAAELGCL